MGLIGNQRKPNNFPSKSVKPIYTQKPWKTREKPVKYSKNLQSMKDDCFVLEKTTGKQEKRNYNRIFIDSREIPPFSETWQIIFVSCRGKNANEKTKTFAGNAS